MVNYRHSGTNFRPLFQESSSLNSILELLDPLNIGSIRCPEPSVNNYHSNLRNSAEERTFLKSSPFWNVTRCRLVVGFRLFGTNYRSLHQEPNSLRRNWNAWLLCCPETSPTKCQRTPYNMAQKRKSELHGTEAWDFAYWATFKSNCLPAGEDDSYMLMTSGANVIPWNRPCPLSATSNLLRISKPLARTVRHIINYVVDKTSFNLIDCFGLCESTI
jgi:hypothetical protein